MVENYQIILDGELRKIRERGAVPTLLLHACCAPCSSYVLEYLSEYFNITLFFYNPNISPEAEFDKRAGELGRLVSELPRKNDISVVVGSYDSGRFFEMSKGLEDMPEGGERCFRCYRLRLAETAAYAKEGGFDYFTTTLSISPHKNAQKLNEIGKELSAECGVSYLYSDFKKRGGYKRSCELSAEYGLYRQNYCGCVFSKAEAQRREAQKIGQ
ncbi:MAG: epoxyqueuosine reductase QueH [Firmicutes bacterium]|nr:epoxyqueuosine reductase QueH [Bacillota bacterium]